MNNTTEKEFSEQTKTGTWPEVKGIPGDADEDDNEDDSSCSSSTTD